MKEYTLNRKAYDRVRKMDHGQMTEFFRDAYDKGYAEGKKDASGLSREKLREVLLSVKGVGEKKANEIMQAIITAQGERSVLTDG